ncbi:hypothetical protein ACFYRD_40680 [Streptomyces hirsutus]|uniref:hypothetical protein n=1 Tax=Streptomyces hirsutus TaxID=35620 RepID=UPI003699FDE0
MSEAQIAIVVACIGLIGAIVAAVAAIASARMASRATLRQPVTQAEATHAQWLMQQRQASYEEFISSWEQWISAISHWTDDEIPLLRELDIPAMEDASRQLTTRAVRIAALGPDCVAVPSHKLARSAALFTAAKREARTAVAEHRDNGVALNLSRHRQLSDAAGPWNSRQELYREFLAAVRHTLVSPSVPMTEEVSVR